MKKPRLWPVVLVLLVWLAALFGAAWLGGHEWQRVFLLFNLGGVALWVFALVDIHRNSCLAGAERKKWEWILVYSAWVGAIHYFVNAPRSGRREG